MIPPPPRSTLFPYTTLFRSIRYPSTSLEQCRAPTVEPVEPTHIAASKRRALRRKHHDAGTVRRSRDRKSTRLNSSHSQISYADFCLKKKNTQHDEPRAHRTP